MDARALLQSLGGERAQAVRFVEKRIRSSSDAEDIVQRAVLRAAERAASLEDPARVRAWFYRILRNTLVDHHRATAAEASRQRDAELDAIPAIADAAASTPCACSARLLGELRPSYAAVIQRVDVDGLAPSAAAEALGISKGNLDVRLHRARKSLRDAVCAYCGVGSHAPCLDCTCDGAQRCGSG